MKILFVCFYIVAATAAAAVIPVDNLRQRRDISEVAGKYLPPTGEPVTEYLPPAEDSATKTIGESELPQDSAILGKKGYEYKTVRRLKYRNRRDAPEAAPGYLPPAEESVTEVVEANLHEEVPQDSAILGKNGYEYKTVRLLKSRKRRDVSEICTKYLPPNNESVDDVSQISPKYLPPAEEPVIEAVVEALPEEPEVGQDSAILGKNGYEYKTVRRLKYRKRRDVSKIATKYLPPNNESVDDVSQISPKYLPPAEETVTEAVVEALPEESEVGQDSAILGKNGYEYKTVRRLKYRKRRDVSKIATKYLPPNNESVDDVSQISPKYLPPAEETVTEAVVEALPEEPEVGQDSAILGKNGYEYKTVRRLKYRKRRDVSEIAAEYLPPTIATDTPTIQLEEDSTTNGAGALLEDGYHYDIPKKEFLIMRVEDAASPQEEDDSEVVEALSDTPASAILAKDGYHYRTIKRIRY